MTVPQTNGPIAEESFPLNLEKPKNSPNFSVGASSVTMIRCAVQVPPKAGPATNPIMRLNIKGMFAPISIYGVVKINTIPIINARPHKTPTR